MLVFRTIHSSPTICIRDYTCRACQHGPAAEEYSDSNSIVLMRRGAFCKHFGRRSATADVNQAVFFLKNSNYSISHPADGGDRGTVFELSQRVLNEMVRELDPSVDDHPDKPVPFVLGPCAPDLFWRHRRLVQRLEAADSQAVEPLWADVTALGLIADVLRAAFARHGLPNRSRRTATNADHIDRVEQAKRYLAARLSQRVGLDDVARAVHASPFHLARVFKARTGIPVHRYLMRLRLRVSLERLAQGAKDLTELALELGFSSHGHFADAFRREFGCTPSHARTATSGTHREMSKNLEV
jgi:AraC-like DNA-binding protein